MSQTTEIAERLKGLREMLEISTAEMAQVAGVDEQTYCDYEAGKSDFSVTFLYNCAEKFGVDVTALITGHTPKLSSFSIVRAGQGVLTERRHMFTYQHLAQNFRDRTAEPFLVTAPYDKKAEEKPIPLSAHKGQEMDYILSGELKINIAGREEILYAGDTAYYDSGQPHGMIAVGGKDCEFLAIVLKPYEN
ncbi:MAG: XRE family transcriptional regulator [Clostridia bacterium]|nr:XRE family transcriptional regulator [Clostridia bacterium]